MIYTVYFTRTDNGEVVNKQDFNDYDTALEFAETWASNELAYQIVEW